jgi:hypothetical protein
MEFNDTNHLYHWELWNWLSQNPGYEKSEWPQWNRNGGSITDSPTSCFACEAARTATVHSNEFLICLHCPLCIFDAVTHECLNGLYRLWQAASGFTRSQLAKTIRDLPWKPAKEKNAVDTAVKAARK